MRRPPGLRAERRAVRSVEEQQARITAAAVAPRPIRGAIAEAQGLMCAEEVVTERPMPGFDQAAIDGYAVRSVDVLGVGEVGSDSLPAPIDDSPENDGRDGLGAGAGGHRRSHHERGGEDGHGQDGGNAAHGISPRSAASTVPKAPPVT